MNGYSKEMRVVLAILIQISAYDKIIKVLDTNPEYFIVKDNRIEKAGCNPQLWTIAAKKYFQRIKH